MQGYYHRLAMTSRSVGRTDSGLGTTASASIRHGADDLYLLRPKGRPKGRPKDHKQRFDRAWAKCYKSWFREWSRADESGRCLVRGSRQRAPRQPVSCPCLEVGASKSPAVLLPRAFSRWRPAAMVCRRMSAASADGAHSEKTQVSTEDSRWVLGWPVPGHTVVEESREQARGDLV
jgi:hypothetical protein